MGSNDLHRTGEESLTRLRFQLEGTAPGSRARAARFTTLHGDVETPLFMPVGTQASVKAQTPEALKAAGSQILLANTYHLLLRPGVEVFQRFGGYHDFTTWKRSVLTDSGGFQIFSLPDSRVMREEGALFKSYIDGRTIELSPERSIEVQKAIGSDIMMALDQCIPSTADRSEAQQAMELTHRWASRSLKARADSPQALFGIVQGALFKDLRKRSAQAISSLDFDGVAIGGLAVGESRAEREDTCEWTTSFLPEDRPRYLMGVGTPVDLLEAVHRGVDMFDCIIPTQVAQRGNAFTSRGLVKIRRTAYRLADEPLDPACSCPTCSRFSRAYLHHLSKASEPLAWTLLGQHNIYFYHQLMADMRRSILDGSFLSLYRARREVLASPDLDSPRGPAPRPKNKLPTRGAFAIEAVGDGVGNILHLPSGERMHAGRPPMQEAQELYVDQGLVAERLGRGERVTIWDVGLGAAANAMAALETAESAGVEGAHLDIISFESDLDALRLARSHTRYFPYLRHAAPAALLETGRYESSTCRWLLLEGDFRAHLPTCSPPDLIFFDLFSQHTYAEGWTLDVFEAIYNRCVGRDVSLFTYTSSTAVRALMLAAGFWVASGVGTGARVNSTIALSRAESLESASLLGPEWLSRWQRSAAQVPPGTDPRTLELVSERLHAHPQFHQP